MKRLSIAAVVAALALALPAAVSAHHADVVGQLDCEFTLRLTVSAWEGVDGPDHDASRSNPEIGVWIDEYNSGSFVRIPGDGDSRYGTFEFTPDNDFTFSFDYPTINSSEAVVRVQALARWGNGNRPGPARETIVTRAADCDQVVPPTPRPTGGVALPTEGTNPDDIPLPATDTESGSGDQYNLGDILLTVAAYAFALAVLGAIADRFFVPRRRRGR